MWTAAVTDKLIIGSDSRVARFGPTHEWHLNIRNLMADFDLRPFPRDSLTELA